MVRSAGGGPFSHTTVLTAPIICTNLPSRLADPLGGILYVETGSSIVEWRNGQCVCSDRPLPSSRTDISRNNAQPTVVEQLCILIFQIVCLISGLISFTELNHNSPF